MNAKKYTGLLLVVMLCALFTAGCWDRRELDTLGILMGMGIDKSKTSGKVELTAQITKPSEMKTTKKEEAGSSGQAYWTIRSTGDTVFDALRNFTHQSSRKVYLPHNQIIIFGWEAAEDGIQKYIDLFLRDPETRLNVSVLVAKGPSEEILDVKSELQKIPAMDIQDLVVGQRSTSRTATVKLKDLLGRLMSKTTAPIAPLIEVAGQGEKRAVLISGTAVFKKDKLAGLLDETETRGLLWVINEVKSGIIVVDCPDGDGGKVSLEIVRAKSKFSPVINGDRMQIKVEIKEEGNLGEQSCTENLATPQKFEALKDEAAEAIRNEIMTALMKARQMKTDIFGFGEAIHQKYPKQWENMESRWEEVFPDMEVELVVETDLDLTGEITGPVVLEQE